MEEITYLNVVEKLSKGRVDDELNIANCNLNFPSFNSEEHSALHITECTKYLIYICTITLQSRDHYVDLFIVTAVPLGVNKF